MGDRHLEAAAEALAFGYDLRDHRAEFTSDYWRQVAANALVAHYDSLLGELPEEAVKRLESAYLDSANALDAREEFREAARAFLRSLRDSLASGQGQEGRDDG